MNNFFHLLLALSADWGYAGIVFLMTIESSFIPLPSEIIIPPPAYLASQGQMNLLFVIIAGVIGSVCGALFNYFLARQLGRPLVYTLLAKPWAKIFLINEAKMKHAEEYFIKYGNSATFIGRLIPGVRHLISIPAGFAKMNIFNFILYTVLGSTLWVTVLAVLGYWFGANQDLLLRYYDEIGLVGKILGAVFVAGLVVNWLIKNKLKKKQVKI